MAGRVAAVIFVLSMLASPLQLDRRLIGVGLLIYAAGYLLALVSLREYGQAEEDEIVSRGPYRYSRNPQYVGLVWFYLATPSL